MSYADQWFGLSEQQIREAIENGQTLTEIAKTVGHGRSTLTEWIKADSDRSARFNASRMVAAAAWDDLAEFEIRKASNPFELTKAREIAHHYRWRASKIAPKEYGDKLETTHVGAQPVVIDGTLAKL